MCHLGYKIKISGLVQGVGFRPLVFEWALRLNLFGEVRNDGFGVEIILACTQEECEIFIEKIKNHLPTLARIDKLDIIKTSIPKYTNFKISSSLQNTKSVPMLSDFSLCKQCKKEFFDKNNVRFLYPFITCTHCGPRFSIIKSLPYDRCNTSMQDFIMCEFCKSEYEDPKNRRFHAQPISCPQCKISVFLKNQKGEILAEDTNAFVKCAQLLKEGKILAIKGMGGFHLMCDAFNEETLKLLRMRKNRPEKPFALMCKDLNYARELAFINEHEEALLSGNLAPIVILRAKKKYPFIAPNVNKLGIMLAYTPLHLLLFEFFNGTLVATSANLSGESIIKDEKNLLQKLSGVFDFYLDYEREIINASDDSIAQVFNKEVMFLRTSRALNPFYLENQFKQEGTFLALGAELKNEFVIFYENKFLISPYIGDLKSVDVHERFFSLLEFFKQNYDLKFDAILCDKHPHFSYIKQFKNTKKIAHHYAHFCAAYFEYEKEFIQDEKALAFIYDGTGYGEDGKIWGGEIFIGNLKEYERIAHFENFTLINSDIKNIQNLALSLIWHYNLEDQAQEFLNKIPKIKLENLKKIYTQSTLQTSSLGRIIDAFGSIVFNMDKISYEAHIGLMCEAFYDEKLDFSYELFYEKGQINFKNLILGALKDDKTKAITGMFNALANFIITFSKNYNLKVLVSGGVFQNKTLLELLKNKNFKFYVPLKYPCNDSSIALGQMVHYLNLQKLK
ncbi:carbamoyltransferase HypF [Campylobacter hepaticus]|uniref:Carbamoyltransferase n=1 Tax=Campylobacter hepaticus TaxID=1813019 RepID=A0A6A7JRW9_9BACT|nr:carbamoyltransferase HypF [Campylobacter hepaticus]AXP08774.1 carbamoyltransferase HypF [Campylobacter hepaticus]MCZ0772625.1 carbamoyltransferase HypF [Campylobacter hepaticus]MCZ0774093.1 carbamoyltransferase HypF [Campylobacter hepaticus]MCZ0775345.1 carbamoyltransferase HypF [Campylobacter hepaticus]MDX2323057.1 carbamoyltransferase HypF [Campylobacter hepaticus]